MGEFREGDGALCPSSLQAASLLRVYSARLSNFRVRRFCLSLSTNGKLVIDSNHGPIHLLQAAFYAVRLEVQRRNASVVCC
jgi:hypothetical protein